MGTAQTRQPAGRPAGGQYAAAEHGEAEIRLAPFATAEDRAEYLHALEEAAVELAERTQRALMVDRALRVRALAPERCVLRPGRRGGHHPLHCRVGEAFGGCGADDFALLLYQEIGVEDAVRWQPERAA